MEEKRPTPEQMLARLKAEGEKSLADKRRGRLKLFFGYAAGVGKTYAMLEAAHAQRADGVDVVVGYVEPHVRPETKTLLEGLEALAVREIPYHGAVLKEFDLDTALARRPALILVDELAHTNVPGSRHVKRWQDVEELLAAGIDVFTTINVQHIESLNDVVSQITGVVTRETVPDAVFVRADDLSLVDLPPDELLERLRQGKIYIPEQAARALEHFFRKENLAALRELSLRETAKRVHADVEAARTGVAAALPWPTAERLLVCIGPSPTSTRVVRATKRLADALKADWVAVHVETPGSESMREEDRQRLVQNIRLAERLGAESVTLSGDDVARATLDYARTRNVTKIVLGKTDEARGWLFHRESIVGRLLRDSGNIDVHIVRGVEEPFKYEAAVPPPVFPWMTWLGTALALALATGIAWAMHSLGFTEANLVMVYLLGVVAVATRFGPLASAAASVGSVLLFDVLFTQPYYSVTVHDTRYFVTFAVMLFIGLLISTLTVRVNRQRELSRRSERRGEALYRLSRQLTGLSGDKGLVAAAEEAVAEVFGGTAVIFIPDPKGRLHPIVGHSASFAAEVEEAAGAQWVYDKRQTAGAATDTLPRAKALYLPLETSGRPVGVLGIQHPRPQTLFVPETRQLLGTYCAQIALAIEREQLAQDSRRTQLDIEAEKLRSALLSSVSHDLRTPLAAIAGASDSLLRPEDNLPLETRKELLETIQDESHRLSQLVENILHMTRLTSGRVTISKEWHPVEDVVGSALHRMKKLLGEREVATRLAPDLPLGYFDAVLVEQVLMNLLDNALKYSPSGSPVEIAVSASAGTVVFQVADRGKGISEGEEDLIFEKFYRDRGLRPESRGTGLGLAICKAIVQAHGGTIRATNRPGGGAVLRFSLPPGETHPIVNLPGDPAPEKP